VDELVEVDELTGYDDVLIESEDDDEYEDDDEAPTETSTTFWGSLTEFVCALLTGIPA
jgi:hypothetical protein